MKLLNICRAEPRPVGPARGVRGRPRVRRREGLEEAGSRTARPPARPARCGWRSAEEGRLARTVEVSGTLAADEQTAARLQDRRPAGAAAGGHRLARAARPGDRPARRHRLRAQGAPGRDRPAAGADPRSASPPTAPDDAVDPAQTAGVKQAAATLKQAQLTRERMAKLFDEQLIPKSDLETADANLGVADGRYQEAIETARTRQALLSQRRSELAIAQQQLADSALTAPFDGAIRERLVNAGDYLAAGTPVAVLVRVHPLRLRLAVPEREAAGIRVGQPVELTVEGVAAQHTGQVARISPSISEDNRTLMVEAEVPNADGGLRPGGFARAGIVVQAGDSAVLVPASADRHLRRHREGGRRRRRQGGREAGPHRPPRRRPGGDRRRDQGRRAGGGAARQHRHRRAGAGGAVGRGTTPCRSSPTSVSAGRCSRP